MNTSANGILISLSFWNRFHAISWVAKCRNRYVQALCAPVPEGYRELEDHLGKTFYLDSETNEAAWEHPFDEVSTLLRSLSYNDTR